MHPAVARDIIVEQARLDTAYHFSSQEQASVHDASADSRVHQRQTAGHSHQNSNMRGVSDMYSSVCHTKFLILTLAIRFVGLSSCSR
jgi:hypothetical protein